MTMSGRPALVARAKRALTRWPKLYLWGRRSVGLARYALRRPHEKDFAGFAHFPSRSGLFLDVGANAGQSALSFRIFNRRSPILSIEPLIYHEADLRFLRRALRRFDYRICAAGEEDGKAVLHVPFYREVPLTGESSLLGEAGGCYWASQHLDAEAARDVRVRDLEVPICRLDNLGLEPDFLKIDVEGFEIGVLRGLVDTVARCRPVFLIERSQSEADVREFLTARGYVLFAYDAERDALEPFDGHQTLNLFFVPEEDADVRDSARASTAASATAR